MAVIRPMLPTTLGGEDPRIKELEARIRTEGEFRRSIKEMNIEELSEYIGSSRNIERDISLIMEAGAKNNIHYDTYGMLKQAKQATVRAMEFACDEMIERKRK